MDNFGNIFSDTFDMGSKSSDVRAKYQRNQNSDNAVHSGRSSNIDYNLYTLFKQAKEKMATVKIGWILFNILGWPTAIFTFLSALFGDIVLGDIGEPARSIVIILGIVFIVVKILISYEHWREKHIANQEKEFELQRKKGKNFSQLK